MLVTHLLGTLHILTAHMKEPYIFLFGSQFRISHGAWYLRKSLSSSPLHSISNLPDLFHLDFSRGYYQPEYFSIKTCSQLLRLIIWSEVILRISSSEYTLFPLLKLVPSVRYSEICMLYVLILYWFPLASLILNVILFPSAFTISRAICHAIRGPTDICFTENVYMKYTRLCYMVLVSSHGSFSISRAFSCTGGGGRGVRPRQLGNTESLFTDAIGIWSAKI